MNGNDLLKALSYVDEQYVDEAEQPARRTFRWQPIAAAAACFCLILLAARFWMPIQKVHDVAFAPRMEAAKSVVSEEVQLDTADILEAASANSVNRVLLQMTVRAGELHDGILTCTVTDPGTTEFAKEETVTVSLTQEQQTQLMQNQEAALWFVTFLPADDGTILPIEMTPAEDKP